MYLMGLTAEFQDARQWVESSLNLNQNVDVNLFETTIRVLGSLLSTYHLTGDQMFLDRAVGCGQALCVAGFALPPDPIPTLSLSQSPSAA